MLIHTFYRIPLKTALFHDIRELFCHLHTVVQVRRVWCACVLLPVLSPAALALQDEPRSERFYWEQYNRNISIVGLSLNQSYVEQDTSGRTADGVFNSESGRVSGYGAQARWQGTIADLLPVWSQLSSSLVTGQTDYNGYTQSGALLTPLKARTGNEWQRHALQVGLPVQPMEPLQLVPYVAWTEQRWQRNLLQYGETYRYSTQSSGILAQWRMQPAWVLEVDYQRSYQTQARLSAPILGFDAALPGATSQSTALALRYAPSTRWSLFAEVVHSRLHSEASVVINNLQAPPARTDQSTWSLGLSLHY